MDMPFRISDVLRDEVSVIEANSDLGVLTVRKLRRKNDVAAEQVKRTPEEKTFEELNFSVQEKLINIVDKMGEASAKAQDLDKVITSSDKLVKAGHTLYVLRQEPEKDRFTLQP